MKQAERRQWAVIRSAARVVFGLLMLASLCVAYGFFIEPTWLKVRHVTVSKAPTVKVIFFTDLHYKGDRKYLKKVIATINRVPADFVCFGGDIAEEPRFFEEALRGIATINKPVYGVPGNHDYWSRFSFDQIAMSFRATGGDWLCDTNLLVCAGTVEIVGRTGREMSIPALPSGASGKRILLVHYPEWTDQNKTERFHLVLAGHTHGGQVRLPFFGPLLTWVDGQDYRSGLFLTSIGPLYVGRGVGTFLLPFRFFCRPEIVVIEL